MGLRKGQTNNPKGRPKGSTNKVTLDIKESISEIIEKQFNPKKIQADLKDLSPKDRLNFLIKLLEYSVPKVKAIEDKEPGSDQVGSTSIFSLYTLKAQKYIEEKGSK